MVRSIGLGLARVTVVAPHSRIDVALPEHVLVAELMPGLLRHAGDELADTGQRHSGWVLRRDDGTGLEAGRTLAAQNVLDGTTLYLAPRRTDWPEPEFDDLVDSISVAARRNARAWSAAASRAFGLGASATFLAALLILLMLAGPPWTTSGVIALSVSGALLLAGVLLARTMSDVDAGTMLAAAALPLGGVGAMLASAGPLPLAGFGAAQLLAFCGGLLAVGVTADLGVASERPLFVAATVMAVFGGFAALLTVAGLTAAGAAAVLAGVIVVFTPAVPLIGMRLGKLPTPNLPMSAEDLRKDDDLPKAEFVHARVVRSDQLVSGILLGASVVLVGCQLELAMDPTIGSTILVALVAAGTVLRARIYPTFRHRLPLLLAGLAGAVTLGITALRLPPGWMLGMGTAGATALALLSFVAGLVLSRRKTTPSMGRWGDIAESVCVLAIVPVACGVLGVYGQIRGLAG
ncbi:type VII secretion integral membrane protein EccD [Amycolatopsis taiwanensis]|uniref:Type VII secretion integral membrane protein EccD n=1 Tax=Amycolatopsis taiwanensis TaxID=342230 RepID=A0A9W6QW88_9PSEU|nr:type VII secretion integral membrane protein EccD [Amycolatopsis taiwanensis]GLY64724.1 type VII secretion integral membrane protein EccD [Amycolatopsis taiwanensis]